jgi:NADH:ubiquinone oxidoreductase subunit 2 (subunit N)
LAGVPPLNGFWSKFILFASAIDAGEQIPWAPYLAIAGILNSALSLGYYAWVMRRMYFDEPTGTRVKEPKLILAVLIFAMVFMVGFGVYPTPLIAFSKDSVPSSGIFFALPKSMQDDARELSYDLHDHI